MTSYYRFATLTGLSVVFLSTLACSINAGGPVYPSDPIPISTESVLELNEQFKSAIEAGTNNNGTIAISVTEAQITSYLTFKFNSQTEPILTNPQVYLRDGQMHIYGITHKGIFVANIGINVSVSVNEQGQPEINLISADFGPFPVPEGFKEVIVRVVQEAFTGTFGPIATGFRLENVSIADGIMTVTGRIK